jgi:hypothetical protein
MPSSSMGSLSGALLSWAGRSAATVTTKLPYSQSMLWTRKGCGQFSGRIPGPLTGSSGSKRFGPGPSGSTVGEWTPLRNKDGVTERWICACPKTVGSSQGPCLVNEAMDLRDRHCCTLDDYPWSEELD